MNVVLLSTLLVCDLFVDGALVRTYKGPHHPQYNWFTDEYEGLVIGASTQRTDIFVQIGDKVQPNWVEVTSSRGTLIRFACYLK